MKPYPEGTRDQDEIMFNKELSFARLKVECFDRNIDFAVKNTIACAVLHNLCIQWRDNWGEDDIDDDNPCPPNVGPSVQDGDDTREILPTFQNNETIIMVNLIT